MNQEITIVVQDDLFAVFDGHRHDILQTKKIDGKNVTGGYMGIHWTEREIKPEVIRDALMVTCDLGEIHKLMGRSTYQPPRNTCMYSFATISAKEVAQ